MRRVASLWRRGRSTRAALAAITVVVVAAALSAATAAAQTGTHQRRALTHVTFQLDFGTDGKHAAVYLAQKKGYFEQQGLDVSIVPGQTAGLTLNSVIAGKADMGISTFATLALADAKQAHVKGVMLLYAQSPIAIASLKKRLDLSYPGALAGHSIGVPAGSTLAAALPILLAVNHVDPSAVHQQTIAPSLFVQSLLQGQLDAIPSFTNESYCVLQQKAAAANEEISLLKFGSWRVNIYDALVVATDQMIKQHADVVRKVVKAITQAAVYMRTHAQEATDAVIAAAPQLSASATLCQVNGTIDLGKSPSFDKHGYGWFDPKRVKANLQLLVKAYKMHETLPATSLYTNAYITGPK